MVRYLGLVAVLLLVSGCDNQREADLDANRTTWKIHGFKHYWMNLAAECRCGMAVNGSFIVEVREGKIVKAVFASDKSPVPAYTRSKLPTVEGLFGMIEAALRDEWGFLSETGVRPAYHPLYGYPVHTGIRPLKVRGGDLNWIIKYLVMNE
ncbi:MAG: hypothetical protein F4114_13440 [Rhodospirillaceae bacterium]|nr:hypothetical protein [Rhodospirillaceae bacterium]MYB12587.1 hypothetical protein [Rhodospirillaceae bacterium]MYI50072.1 hypothetical protein [Rhodospirillaceae bacterium]